MYTDIAMTQCDCNKPSNLKKINELADFLKVIADTNRLKILCLLKDGKRCVCNIHEPLSLPQNLASHHLRVLKEAGLVFSTKKGNWVYYRINENKIKEFNNLYLFLLKQKAKKVPRDNKKEC